MADLFSDFTPPTGDGPYTERSMRSCRPLSRSNDPSSSAIAAADAIESGRAGRHAAIVLALVRRYPGMTAVELHASQGAESVLERHEVSRRLSDLMRQGMVIQAEQRACSVKGTPMVTWWAIES